ncbi:MAG TPA: lamin tail domain-containing protein [Candidatus Krumholzibacteria bacterium]|nr:lamin tail domain-containing protein [Candidatus Krumholzibacteria bacterium]HPD71252.1 lamin tail domain-containing protein [Candidatus Krumholzibacteria bacterium]HRY39048.1 lamin tail domain-containing protein [Candidatus Krumholzibacteria bacterium]
MVLCLWLFAAGAPVINEVCYDPAGADAGAEFVEIFNPDTCAVDLAGYRLEFANGADEPRWLGRWVATAGDRIAAGACFLVADAGWSGPAADATATLALQNGPDALRLVRADGSVDLVGWGDLAWPELSEGAPAADVVGEALARRPDGRDTDQNAEDFRPAAPTPGARNWPAFALACVAVRLEPPSLVAAGEPIAVTVTVRNDGFADLAGAAVSLAIGAADSSETMPPLVVGAETAIGFTVRPRETGLLPVVLRWRGAAPADTASLALGRYHVGPHAVRLSEVMAAPAGGGEWCELVNADAVPRNLAELALRDEDGTWRGLPDETLVPGDCRLLAQDAAALAAWLDDIAAAGAVLPCDPAPPIDVPGWPSLNNSAPGSRTFADRLYLGLADGTVVDHVTVGAGSGVAPDGRSLERGGDLGWRAGASTAGGTPGCLPGQRPELAPGALRFEPNPFSPREGDGAIHAYLNVPDEIGGWELCLFDLWGRQVRDLGGDDLGPGPREAVWDGRDDAGEPLPAGGYVAVVRWRSPEGRLTTASRRLVVIREASP